MQKPKVKTTNPSIFDLYETPESLENYHQLTDNRSIQFPTMNHGYEYYNYQTLSEQNSGSTSQQQHESDNSNDKNKPVNSPQPSLPVSNKDVPKFEDPTFSDFPSESLGNYVTASSGLNRLSFSDPLLQQSILNQTYEANLQQQQSQQQQISSISSPSQQMQLPPVPVNISQSPQSVLQSYNPLSERKVPMKKTTSSGSKRLRKSNTAEYRFIGNIEGKPLTPFHSLPYYRRLNSLTFDNFRNLNVNPGVKFEANKKFRTNMYEPAVNKKYNIMIGGNSGEQMKGSSQGNFALCPYCEITKDNIANNCEKMFYKRNDSNYLHHMIQYHGIFSNGELVRDPEIRGWAVTDSDKNSIEVVQCPYCGEYISLKKFKLENRGGHRLLKYLRHVKEKHKTGKNLQIMQKR